MFGMFGEKRRQEEEGAELAAIGQDLARGLESMFRLTAGLMIRVASHIGPPIRGQERTFSQLVIEITDRSGKDVHFEDIRDAVEEYLSQQAVAGNIVFKMMFKKEARDGRD
jgi:hypothetical protein